MFELVEKLSPQITPLVDKSQKILLSLHVGADYDSIGSTLGLADILKTLGKKVEVFSCQPISSEISSNQKFLKGFSQIKFGKFLDLKLQEFDLFFCLDSETPYRISLDEEIHFPLTIPTIVIDHHPNNDQFGDVNLVIPKDTCTSELVFRLAESCHWPVTPASAICLFVGLWADTGQFMFPGSTTLETYKTAAHLIEIGKFDVTDLIWYLKSIDDRVVRASGIILSRAEELFNGQVLFTTFGLSDLALYGLGRVSTDAVKEFIAHNLSYTRRPSITVVIYQKGENWYKVSFRSNNLLNLRDVSLIARKIGHGGGHARAAAADVKMTLTDAKKLVLDKIQATFPDLGPP
jgi:phosphoesterase RecJ-like protein